MHPPIGSWINHFSATLFSARLFGPATLVSATVSLNEAHTHWVADTAVLHSDWIRLVWLPASAASAAPATAAGAADATTGDSRANTASATGAVDAAVTLLFAVAAAPAAAASSFDSSHSFAATLSCQPHFCQPHILRT